MALIKTIDTGLYRIPLTVSLSDSTHGKIDAFEWVTCRVRDSEGRIGPAAVKLAGSRSAFTHL